MATNKARIVVLDDQGEEAGSISLPYNPETYSAGVAMTWAEQDGLPQFKSSQVDPMTVTILFDAYEAKNQDVRAQTQKFNDLLKGYYPGLGNPPSVRRVTQIEKPACRFEWGKFVFKGFVQSFKEEFVLFLPDGTPVRSKVTLTINPWPVHT